MRRNTSGARRHTTRQQDANALVAQRIAAIEQIVSEQRERIAQQELELERLRATLAAEQSPQATRDATIAAEQAHEKKQPLLTSRRALLLAGGTVAAAAAIEAVALSGNLPAAQAHGTAAALGGVTWQTGTVSADVETLVKPSSPSYASNDILQVQLGTGTVYQPASLKSAITAYDTTGNNIGVYGTSQTGYGLYGVTDSGNGAKGAGLTGIANSGVGVVGTSAAGIGVSGNSTNGLGASFSGGQAPIALATAGFIGAPISGNHVTGEVVADANAELWVCVAPGTPGAWTKLAHLSPGATSGGAITYLSKPIRLLDTRLGFPALNAPGIPFASNSTNTLLVQGVYYNTVQVPYVCAGAIGNVTVVAGSGGGYLALVPTGAGFSGTAVLAYAPCQVVSNSFNVGLANGQVDIIIGGAGTNVIFDLFAVVS